MPRYASVNIDRAGVSLVLFDTTLMGAEGVEDGPVLQKILRLDWKQVADLVEEPTRELKFMYLSEMSA